MNLAALLIHRQVATFLAENNLTPPAIPAGCNSVHRPLILADGRHAIVLNQTSFAPTATDNEEECNGLSLFILDEPPTDQGRDELMNWMEEQLR